MAELGKIPSETKLSCPGCGQQLESVDFAALLRGEPYRCPGCRQQLLLPSRLAARLREKVALEGASALHEASEQAAALECPGCRGTLLPLRCERSALELDRCGTCHGLWFDREELRQLLSTPELRQQFRLPDPGSDAPISDPEQRLCARCAQRPLTPRLLKDVQVDECSECQGIWLDAGEIARLIALQEQRENAGGRKPPDESSGDNTADHQQGVFSRLSQTVVTGFQELFT